MKHRTATLLLTLAAVPALAQDGEPAPAVSGGLTVVAQDTSDAAVRGEVLASVDLGLVVPLGPGELVVTVEGSTTPQAGHVAARVGEANADAGSALDASGAGRLQVSELYYAFGIGPGTLTAGLMDLAGNLDASDIAGDETTQFLGAPFTGNPTLAAPDYTLGMNFVAEPEEGVGPGYALALGRALGLADVCGAYADVFGDRRVDTDCDGRDDTRVSRWLAGEFFWRGESATYRAGLWVDLTRRPDLAGTATDARNRGLYALADWDLGAARVNARLGLANDAVSIAARFAAFAVEWPQPHGALGAAVALTQVADDYAAAVADAADSTHAELYWRYDAGKYWHLTPSVQYIANPGFDSDPDGSDLGGSIVIYGLRLGAGF